MTVHRVDICDAKYTVVLDDDKGELTVLRHGEPWRNDFVGDNFVHGLVYELIEARSKSSQFTCSHASGPHNEPCDLVVGLSKDIERRTDCQPAPGTLSCGGCIACLNRRIVALEREREAYVNERIRIEKLRGGGCSACHKEFKSKDEYERGVCDICMLLVRPIR